MSDENIDPRLLNLDAGQDVADQTNDIRLPPPPQGSELHTRHSHDGGQSPGNVDHHTWVPISSHTAKCDLCLEHNTSVCQRCLGCNRQLCRNCIHSARYDGVHSFNMADLDWTPAPPVRRGPRAPLALPAGLNIAGGVANTSFVGMNSSTTGANQSSSGINPSSTGVGYPPIGLSSVGHTSANHTSAGYSSVSQSTTGLSSVGPSSIGPRTITDTNSNSASGNSSFTPANGSSAANSNSLTTGTGTRFTARRTRLSSRRNNTSSTLANTSTHANASSSRATSSSTRTRTSSTGAQRSTKTASVTRADSGIQHDSGAQHDGNVKDNSGAQHESSTRANSGVKVNSGTKTGSGTKARKGRFVTTGSGIKRRHPDSDDDDHEFFNHGDGNLYAARRPTSGIKFPSTSRPRSGVKRRYLYSSEDEDGDICDSDDDYEEVIPAKKSKDTKATSSNNLLAHSTTPGNPYFTRADPAQASGFGKHTIKINTGKIKKTTNNISVSGAGSGPSSGSGSGTLENETPGGILHGNVMYTPGYETRAGMSGQPGGILHSGVIYTPGYETRARMSGKKYQATTSASIATTKTRTTRSGRKVQVQASTNITTSTETYDAPSTSQQKRKPISETEQVTEAEPRTEKEAEEMAAREKNDAWKHNEAIRDLKHKGKFREAQRLIEHAQVLMKMCGKTGD